LREVGTTNRTKLADYENAINEKTRVLLRVHPSNFTVTAFHGQPSLEDLVAPSCRLDCRWWRILASVASADLSKGGIQDLRWRPSIDAGEASSSSAATNFLEGRRRELLLGKRISSPRAAAPLFRGFARGQLTIAALEATLGAYFAAPGTKIPVMANDSNDADRN